MNASRIRIRVHSSRESVLIETKKSYAKNINYEKIKFNFLSEKWQSLICLSTGAVACRRSIPEIKQAGQNTRVVGSKMAG